MIYPLGNKEPSEDSRYYSLYIFAFEGRGQKIDSNGMNSNRDTSRRLRQQSQGLLTRVQESKFKSDLGCVCVCVRSQSCPALSAMDCSLPGSSVHGILQGRILEWVDIPFSRGSSRKNPSLLHCRWILYHLSHQGSLKADFRE